MLILKIFRLSEYLNDIRDLEDSQVLLSEEKDDLLKDVLRLNNENQRLVDKIKEIKKLKSDANEDGKLDDAEKNDLNLKISQLKAEIQSKSRHNSTLMFEINNAKKEISEFNNEKQHLIEKIDLANSTYDKLKAEKILLEKELDCLRSNLLKKDLEIKQLNDKIVSLNENLCVCTEDNAAKTSTPIVQSETLKKDLQNKKSNLFNAFYRFIIISFIFKNLHIPQDTLMDKKT